jgi:hypothetical protein
MRLGAFWVVTTLAEALAVPTTERRIVPNLNKALSLSHSLSRSLFLIFRSGDMMWRVHGTRVHVGTIVHIGAIVVIQRSCFLVHAFVAHVAPAPEVATTADPGPQCVCLLLQVYYKAVRVSTRVLVAQVGNLSYREDWTVADDMWILLVNGCRPKEMCAIRK